ncbi:MAG: tetratricopeptide repeat protein [Actinomycetota bacterium]
MTRFTHPAVELLDRGRLTEAAVEARRALVDRPDDPDLLACLGEAIAATDPGDARMAIERASSARPNDPVLLLAAARVQWRTGDHKAAALTAQRVRTLAPKWAEGHATRALITLDQSRRGLRTSPDPELYDLAGRGARSAVVAARDWPTAHIVAGHVGMAAGSHDQAMASAKTALRIDPGNPQALVLLGDAQLAAGDADHARRNYEQARPWPPAVERLRAVRRSGVLLQPGQWMAVALGALLLGSILRASDQLAAGITLSLIGIAACGMVVLSKLVGRRGGRGWIRQETARLLTPGSELVLSTDGNAGLG